MSDPRLDNAMKLRRAGRLNEAAQIYGEILTTEPRHYEALHALGILHFQSGQLEEAERLIGEAVAANPSAPDASYNRACLLMRLNRLDEALDSFDRALALKPDYIEALVNRAAVLGSQKRHEEAIATLDRALALRPDLAQAWANRGNAALALARHLEAVANYDCALALKPNAELWKNRSVALIALGETARALESIDKAAALDPKDLSLARERGNALYLLNRFEEAARNFEIYLAANPSDAEAWNNRGLALQVINRREDAVECFDRALALTPDNMIIRENRANLLFGMDRFEGAAADYEELLKSPAAPSWVKGYITLCRTHDCDWVSLGEARQHIAAELEQGVFVVDPIGVSVLSGSPREQLEAARIWARRNYPAQPPLAGPDTRYAHEKIRVAYISADFRAHATAFLMAGVFEHRDRARFEAFAFSNAWNDASPMRARLERAFDRFIDIQQTNDADVARMMRAMEIDIAVDLKGYTANGRVGILAHRPAPVQAHYLGFPGTLGTDCVDYLIADPVVVPDEDRKFYAEQIAYLPDTYQCNDRERRAGPVPTRKEAGLPDGAFVFACFNNTRKIMPEIFDVWMRLLREVEGSVLWLYGASARAMTNLRREAQARGVAGGRLIFAPPVAQEKHVARQSLADIFLDTLPYNAHTTASDALWVGLPVVTCLGTSFAGRVAASLLNAAGAPELVTHSLDEYEALALKLAREPHTLAAMKAKLLANRETCALFDTVRFTRNLEAAFVEMHARHQRGEKPATFRVEQGAAKDAGTLDGLKARGRGHIARNELGDALAAYDEALTVAPGDAEALRLRADLLFQLERHDDAVEAYNRALAATPSDADAWNQRGIALAQLKRREEAIASFGRALTLDVANADAWNNRANALFELKRFEEAARDYENALRIAPDLPYAEGFLVQCRIRSCDWSHWRDDLARIEAGVAANRPVIDPLGHLVVSRVPERQLDCARVWSADMFPAAKPLWKGERYNHGKIRVAYLSGDFRPHPVAFLIAGVFEHHDRSRFETVGVSFGPSGDSEIRSRIEHGFDRFIEAREKSDSEIASMLRAMEIDIAVDLMGYTEGCRTGITAHRVAPVQVNYLGFPGTMGAPYIDYILADRILIPEDERRWYSEAVVYLPGAYQANDNRRRADARLPTRAEAGFPEKAFVFCCFNNNFKIAPETFDIWMRLLHAVPDSVLWLLKDSEAAAANLVREAQARGVDAARLVFAPRVAPADHLARHALADLFLDTLPYTAHTTASDALWMGLPLLTCTGSTFAGRVATSLLHAAGTPELVTGSLPEYEALASKLGRDRRAVAALKAKLAANRDTHALFDTARITRHLESAFVTMRERAGRGEKPASFSVDAIP